MHALGEFEVLGVGHREAFGREDDERPL